MSPILPENRARYPKDWHTAVRPRIAKRSKDRCECTGQCGEDHKGRCKARNKKSHPVTGATVVLTVMHLDHTPENCEDGNLLHACQKCHNRYDAPHRRETKRGRKAASDMFAASPPAVSVGEQEKERE